MDRSIENMRDFAPGEHTRGRSRISTNGHDLQTDIRCYDQSVMSPDLQDWLDMTHFYDRVNRNEKLSTYRHEKTMERMATLTPQRGSRPRDRSRSRSPRLPEVYRYRGRDYDEAPPHSFSRAPVPDSRHLPWPSKSLPPPLPPKPVSKGDLVKDQRDTHRERQLMLAPRGLSLGEKGDTKFFVIKSCSWGHVYDCWDEGIWATQARHVQILTKAFTEAKKVVLFFSVNKSSAYQGYAIIKSLPNARTTRPRWWNEVDWNISHPFEVDWRCKLHIDDRHVIHLRNPLNRNLSVTRSRDFTEIEDRVGREMLTIIEFHAKREAARIQEERDAAKQPAPPKA